MLCFACGTENGGTGPECTIARVSVTPSQTQIVLGESATLTATVTASNCSPAPTVSWSSGNTAAVSIQASGNQVQITGLLTGATAVTVTASVSSVTGSSAVTVVPRPSIALDVSTLTFTATHGGANPTSQAVTITNGGGGTLSGLNLGAVTYDAGASGWLDVLTLSGTVASPSATLSIQPLTGNLNIGTYTATIAVQSVVASNTPQSVTVSFYVEEPGPTIFLGPPSLPFNAIQGGSSNPPSASTTIANGGSGILTELSVGSIVYGPGADGWLEAPTLSSTTANPTAALTVQPIVGSLAPGTYIATVPVYSSVASNSPRHLNVTLLVTSARALTVVSGNSQTGIAGRALADSLQVRLTAQDGSPTAGTSITWTTTHGSVSPSSTAIGPDGTAWVQWTVATGTGSLVAAVPGETQAMFTGTGRTPASCQLSPSAATQRFSLGPTDFTLSLNAATPIRIVVLFADYSNAPATEVPATLMANIVNPGIAMLEDLSYGRVDVTATAVPTWYRLSQPHASYTWATFAGHRAYFQEVMTLADAAVDFSQFEAVYIFGAPAASKGNSPTFNGGQTNGMLFDGRTIGNGVTFGNDARNFPASIVAHETGHMFGLVDLYAYTPPVGGPFSGNQFQFTGSWSLMADVFRPAHYFAWEKRKLGWLQPSEWDCLEAGAGIEVILDPVSTTGGIKMVVMPTGPSTAIVAEVRRLAGLDANMCVRGVLVYDVDATVASGQGPARIRGSRQNHHPTCGPWGDATFDVGAGQISTLDVPGVLDMRLLGVDVDGRYRVRFKRP